MWDIGGVQTEVLVTDGRPYADCAKPGGEVRDLLSYAQIALPESELPETHAVRCGRFETRPCAEATDWNYVLPQERKLDPPVIIRTEGTDITLPGIEFYTYQCVTGKYRELVLPVPTPGPIPPSLLAPHSGSEPLPLSSFHKYAESRSYCPAILRLHPTVMPSGEVRCLIDAVDQHFSRCPQENTLAAGQHFCRPVEDGVFCPDITTPTATEPDTGATVCDYGEALCNPGRVLVERGACRPEGWVLVRTAAECEAIPERNFLWYAGQGLCATPKLNRNDTRTCLASESALFLAVQDTGWANCAYRAVQQP